MLSVCELRGRRTVQNNGWTFEMVIALISTGISRVTWTQLLNSSFVPLYKAAAFLTRTFCYFPDASWGMISPISFASKKSQSDHFCLSLFLMLSFNLECPLPCFFLSHLSKQFVLFSMFISCLALILSVSLLPLVYDFQNIHWKYYIMTRII